MKSIQQVDEIWKVGSYSTVCLGNDMLRLIGISKNDFPPSQEWNRLGEEFSYEVNVYKGSCISPSKSGNHETRTFTKKSDFL